ncbi:MAG: VWA domain-containing protein, partial [Acidobacteriota bacterium]|nr:VWA domain-containing protein [Acidobacteriota bacterium]
MRILERLAVGSLCLLASVAGQQPEPQSQQQAKSDDTDVVRISTNLVQIDAVVTDKNGKQVTDLKAGDFVVFQDGRPQKVTNLSYISTQPGSVALTEQRPSASSPATAPVPAVVLRPDQVRRTIALVVDDLGLSFESTAFLRKTLTRFVNEQVQPGDLVAIVRTSAGAGALQQFTSDKRQLAAAIDRVRWYPLGRGNIGVFAPLEPNAISETANTIGNNSGGSPSSTQAAANARRLDETAQAEADDLNELREQTFTVGTLGALGYVVRGLSQMPGRKSILLLSDGFQLFSKLGGASPSVPANGRPGIVESDTPGLITNTRVLQTLRRLTDEANRASVVINTMDTRGLQTLTLGAVDSTSGLPLNQIQQKISDRAKGFFDTQSGLAYIARLTGGLALQNENDLNKGIQRVLDDLSGYYLIAYRPDESTFDPKTGRPTFHEITVKLNRPELRVRSRSGFFGVADLEARQLRNTGDLSLALASPFNAADVHLRLTSLFGNDDHLGSILSSVLYIDGHDLTFKDEPGGWHESEIEVFAYTFGVSGEVIDSLVRTHKIRAQGESFESIIRDGLLYTINVPIKKAGAYQLRIAVRDSASKRIGSATQFVEVPDLTRQRLALSGIFVSGLDPHKAKQPAPTGHALLLADEEATDAQASPALRRLRPGMEMHYAYYIYNAKLDLTQRPQLTTQIRLFHDGRLSYEGKATAYDAGGEPDSKRLR